MSAIILPDRWRRQPTGPLSLDQGNHLAQKATAVAVPFGGAVRILTNGKKSDQLGYASGANIRVVGGRAGLGVDGSTSSIDSMRLHSVVNQTDTAWEAPSSAGTWIAVFERLGNSGGSSYLFGNVSPSSSPYTSWGLHDAGGTGSLKVDCSAGGSYRENTVATMGNNTLYVAGGRYNGKNLVGFINGVFSTPTACTGNISYLTHSDRGPAIANFYNYTGENRSFNGRIYLGVLWDSALSDAEIAEFTENPWQVFAKKSNILYFPSAGGGGATIAGDVSETLSATDAGAPTVAWLGTASESIAATTAQASTWSGDVTVAIALAVTTAESNTIATTQSVAETLAVVTAQAQDSAQVMAVTESITATDARDAIGSWEVAATLTVSMQDAGAPVAAFVALASESVSTSSAQDFDGAQVSTVSETIGAMAAESGTQASINVVSESIGFVTVQAGANSTMSAIAEAITADVAQWIAGATIEAALSESVAAQSSVSVLLTLEGVVNVDVGLIDAPVGVASLLGTVEFTAGVAAAVASGLASILGVSESAVVISQEAGAHFSVTAGLPGGRTVTVRFESRQLIVAAENRTVTVH